MTLFFNASKWISHYIVFDLFLSFNFVASLNDFFFFIKI